MMHLQVLDKNLKVTLVWLIIILVLMNELLLKIRQRMYKINKNYQVSVLIIIIRQSIQLVRQLMGMMVPVKILIIPLMQRIQLLMSLTVLLIVWKSI